MVLILHLWWQLADILIDAGRKREGMDDLLRFSSYVICPAKFPQSWTGAPSVPGTLCSVLLKLPKVKFVIVTLGEDGCVMLERSVSENIGSEEVDVDDLLEKLKHKFNSKLAIQLYNKPTSISSQEVKLSAKGIGTVNGRLLLGTAEKIPPSELIDTTGAGDSFIGTVPYG